MVNCQRDTTRRETKLRFAPEVEPSNRRPRTISEDQILKRSLTLKERKEEHEEQNQSKTNVRRTILDEKDEEGRDHNDRVPSQRGTSHSEFRSHSQLEYLEDEEASLGIQTSENAAQLLWERLRHSEYYGKVWVTDTNGPERNYLPPRDFFRCGECLCYKLPQNDQFLYADCIRNRRASRVIYSIPSNLHQNISDLKMNNNPIKEFEIYKLRRYKSLISVTAAKIQIRSLRYQDCCSENLGLEYLSLPNNGISHFEDGALRCLANLTHLILRSNNISHLTNKSLAGLAKLEVLDLSNNKLHSMEAGTFLHSRGLADFNLSLNHEFLLSAKSTDVFKPLSALKALHIEGCASLGGAYPTDVLLTLPALRELSVSGEKHPFDHRLSALKNLTQLTLRNKHGSRCLTKNFTKSYFSGLIYLESLKIQGCSAGEYSPSMFDKNPRIVDFEISENSQDLKSLFKILCYLQNLEKIKSVKISHPNPPMLGPLIVLTLEDVTCLSKMTALTSLNLDMNDISQAGIDFTQRLPSSLQTLSVRGNLLISFKSILFQIMHLSRRFPNLRNLWEGMQGARSRGDIMDAKQANLLDSGWGRSVDQGSVNVLGVHSYEAQSRLLAARKQSGPRALSTGRSVEIDDDSIISLDSYSASRSINLGVDVFAKSNEDIDVAFLNLSETMITHWGEDPVWHLPSNTLIADLSENRCQMVKKTFFKVNNSLVELHARGNFLGSLLSEDKHGSKLSRLKKLEYLDLSRNHLFHLPWLLFQGLSSLRALKLRQNNIDRIDIHVAHMKSLVFIDLAKNSISSISERTRNELDYLAENRELSIDLTFNPLRCTCDGLELFRWMTETPVRILNKDILLCITDNKTAEYVGDLSERVRNLQGQCMSKAYLIMILSFSCVVILILVGSILVFKKRWWIIYSWNLTVSRSYGQKSSACAQNRDQNLNLAAPCYAFDEFFVYAATGRDFVLDECLEELETKRGRRLCVEDRDFLVGSYVPCNITSAVRSSRTTVVVLDEHFRAEGWVKYAVEMAQVEAVRSKRDVLHLLFVGSPPDGCLPGAYLKVLRQGRFSEVPPRGCSPDVREKFWDSLATLLSHADGRTNSSHSLDISDR